jgi:competence protein ComFB
VEFIERDNIDYSVEGQELSEIMNFNERTVLDAMRRAYAADPTLCRCSLCVEDVYALALNALPPRYIQPTSLHLFEASPHFIPLAEVEAKVQEAVARVKAGPKH